MSRSVDTTVNDRLRAVIDQAVAEFAERQRTRFAQISPELRPLIDALESFVGGGKRLRPLFAYWGLRAAGIQPEMTANSPYIRAVAALEWLHACALIHDDVMDASDTRRGAPAMHRLFAHQHRATGWRGDADSYGVASAILLGDLCLVWSDEMLHSAGVPAQTLTLAQPYVDRMRTELMAGQYLDIVSNAVNSESTDRATTVLRYKSAKYTVEYPLLIGAALGGAVAHTEREEPVIDKASTMEDGGASRRLFAALSGYGLPLGEAFQLRDDVLGVFGDPSVTGKPAGDDLREGKRTLLITACLDSAKPSDADLLRRSLGDPTLTPEVIDHLRALITDTGALDQVEQRIAALTDEATTTLADATIDSETHAALTNLARAATARHH